MEKENLIKKYKAEELVKCTNFIHHLNRVTVCILETFTGFYITGTSYCSNEEQFSEELGELYALEKALEQLNGHEAYYIKKKDALSNISQIIR